MLCPGAFYIKWYHKNIKPEKVFIEYQSVDKLVVDSIIIHGNKFGFAGTIDGPTYATMWFVYSSQNEPLKRKKHFTTLFLENGAIEIIRDSSSATFNGSQANSLYPSFQKELAPIGKESDSIYQKYQANIIKKDSTAMVQYEAERERLNKKNCAAYRKEFLRNPASPIAVYLLNVYASIDSEKDPVEFDTLFAKLPMSARSTTSGRDLEKKLGSFVALPIGTIAPVFTQKDTLGIPVKLSSFRGKYLLIDFWASWCLPCRKESPVYVSAYDKFHEKGFEILSVSLDYEMIPWIKAIHKDNLHWAHVSDLQFYKNEVAVQYGIKGVLRNFLIDPSGKIIAKDLRGKDLEQVLDKVLH